VLVPTMLGWVHMSERAHACLQQSPDKQCTAVKKIQGGTVF
jgi:hypothetical protein